MRKFVLGCCLIGSLLVFAPNALAAAPVRESIPVAVTFQSPLYTAACGFPVLVTQAGTLKATLFLDPSASIVHEVDTQPGYKITFSSPATGRSFTYDFAVTTHYEYTDGAAPGSLATVVSAGMVRKVPGIPPDAGRMTFDGTVLFLDAGGVPIVDFGAPSMVSGHVNDVTASIAAGCAALAL
jgi:hypothetical protein